MDKTQDTALEQLYREMYRPLLMYARSVLCDPSLAEEAVQDVFRIACAKIDVLLSSPSPKGWLTNTLKYVLQNTKRSRARLAQLMVSIFPDDIAEIAESIDEPDVDILYADIADSDDFKLLKRIAIDRYTILEAANELGISLEACKKRVQRARKSIRKKMSEHQ